MTKLLSVGVKSLDRALLAFFKEQSQAGATPLEAATVALRTLWLHVDQGGPASVTGEALQDVYNRFRRAPHLSTPSLPELNLPDLWSV